MTPPGATAAGGGRSRGAVVTALGLTQILAWGSSYYLLAVLAQPIALDTGWPLTSIVGGLSVGLIVAGLVSPFVGRTINAGNGRAVLAASAGLLACGLLVLAFATNLATYFAAWVVLGAGMGAGLYDAAFATLGRLYLSEARRLISALTLFGGLASTVCWPLSAFLLEQVGWRGACLTYAAIQLLFAMPLYLFVVPGAAVGRAPAALPAAHGGGRERLISKEETLRFLLLAAVVSLAAAISTMLSVHLLTILQGRGIALSTAVALGATIGPAQVSARFIEMMLGRHYHPIWTKLAATSLVTIGVALLWAGFPIVAVALVFYGAGIGIESIARGTLPLALFDAEKYAAIMGRLALPSLIAQALAPTLGGILLAYGGPDRTLAILSGLAVLNVCLVAALFASCRSHS